MGLFCTDVHGREHGTCTVYLSRVEVLPFFQMVEGVPRKNPLLEREAEICRRLLEFRKASGLSRVRFAQQSGCDSTIISNLEHLRSPLRYWTGKKICNGLRLNPDWLVTGNGSPIWDGHLKGQFESKVSETALLSEVYLENFPEPQQSRDAAQEAFVEEVKPLIEMMGYSFKKMSPEEYRESQRIAMARMPRLKEILASRDRIIIQQAFGRNVENPLDFLRPLEKRKK